MLCVHHRGRTLPEDTGGDVTLQVTDTESREIFLTRARIAREPDDLGRALDDIWVKAHPSRDWTFSEPRAPAPTASHYREDGETGARLYVNAAWDPRWDEEYIAPEVGFESTYGAELQAAVLERWDAFGFPGEGE